MPSRLAVIIRLGRWRRRATPVLWTLPCGLSVRFCPNLAASVEGLCAPFSSSEAGLLRFLRPPSPTSPAALRRRNPATYTGTRQNRLRSVCISGLLAPPSGQENQPVRFRRPARCGSLSHLRGYSPDSRAGLTCYAPLPPVWGGYSILPRRLRLLTPINT